MMIPATVSGSGSQTTTDSKPPVNGAIEFEVLDDGRAQTTIDGTTYRSEIVEGDLHMQEVNTDGASTQSVSTMSTIPAVVERHRKVPLERIGSCSAGCGSHFQAGFTFELSRHADALGKATLGVVFTSLAARHLPKKIAEGLSGKGVEVIIGYMSNTATGKSYTFIDYDYDIDLRIYARPMKAITFGMGWDNDLDDQTTLPAPWSAHRFSC